MSQAGNSGTGATPDRAAPTDSHARAVFRVHEAANRAENLLSFHRAMIAALATSTEASAACALELETSRDTFKTVAAYGTITREETISAEAARQNYAVKSTEVAPGVHQQIITKPPHTLISLPFEIESRQHTIYLIEIPRRPSQQVIRQLERFRLPIAHGLDKLHEIETLTRSNRVKNQLIASTSHDLRNLITTVATAANCLQQRLDDIGRDNVDQLIDLRGMQNATDRMTAVTSQLLDLMALESGKARLDRQCRDLSRDLAEYVRLYIEAAQDKKVRLEVEPPEFEPTAYVDSDRIARVFDNVLNNAIKYTRSGGTVRVSWTQNALETITHIEDTGVGMKPEDLTSLFEEYAPLSSIPTSGESSPGLGLAIAKRIIDAHNGRIWAESEHDTGSRFSFALPKSSEFSEL